MKQNDAIVNDARKTSEQCTVALDQLDFKTLLIKLGGSWILKNKRPSNHTIREKLTAQAEIGHIVFDTTAIVQWDSGLLTFLSGILDQSFQQGITVDRTGLPEGAQKLLELAKAGSEKKEDQKGARPTSFLFRLGLTTVNLFRSAGDVLAFIGEAFTALFNFFRGKARFRRCDMIRVIQDCGVEALPIVSLISLLVGLILAFVGAVQLMMFGAQIYVANLVGIAMVRVMAAVMTGIIMAGRTGAAFAAQLGTMQVNEEIDAFKTMGISPMEFLVLPRMLGLTLMMPLLCLYADLMGLLGGLIVAVGMLDLNIMEYYHQTRSAVGLSDLLIGLIQSTVFGILIALAGCLRGIQCGRSASAVGDAATSAVVTGIVSIIVATAIITVITHVMGI